MPLPTYDAIIVGGGIVGLATALALHRRGVHRILVLEKARALQPIGAAIGLFPNGLRALEAVSPTAHRRVVESAIRMERIVIRDASDGTVLRETVVGEGDHSGHPPPLYLVWYLLQQFLAEELPPGVLRLGSVVESFERSGNGVEVRGTMCGSVETFVFTGRVLVGADGIRSAVRRNFWEEEAVMAYHGKIIYRCLLNLDSIDEGSCPPRGTSVVFKGDEPGKLFAFRETATGIVTITSMATFAEPVHSTDVVDKRDRLRKLFQDYPPVVHHILDRVPGSSIFENAVYDINVAREWSLGNVILVGDAAHAMTPGLGQGANMGLEDAAELAILLSPHLRGEGESSSSIPDVLESFWRGRRDRVKDVHAASSAKSAANSRSSAPTTPAPAPNGPTFLRDLFEWKPSVELDMVSA